MGLLFVNENEKKIGVVTGWARDLGMDGIDEIKKLCTYIEQIGGFFFHFMSIVKQHVDEQCVS